MPNPGLIETLLRRIVRSLFRHSLQWIFAFIALLVLALLSLSRIQLSLDAKDFLPHRPLSEEALALENLHQAATAHFGGKAPTVIVLSAQERMPVDRISPLIDALAERLSKIDAVLRVRHRLESQLDDYIDSDLRKRFLLYLRPEDLTLFSERIGRAGMESMIPEVEKGGLRPLRIFNRDPLKMRPIAQPYFFDLLTGYRIAFVERYFASRDQQRFFILVEPKAIIKNVQDARALTGGINKAIAEIQNDTQFEIGRAHV